VRRWTGGGENFSAERDMSMRAESRQRAMLGHDGVKIWN
jgi:hypothetical protein